MVLIANNGSEGVMAIPLRTSEGGTIYGVANPTAPLPLEDQQAFVEAVTRNRMRAQSRQRTIPRIPSSALLIALLLVLLLVIDRLLGSHAANGIMRIFGIQRVAGFSNAVSYIR
jgi:L-asparaginase/Glu-tRNA(Gln) amidotransferase subunit D